MKVLVTGATGFLGGAILKALHQRQGVHIVAACRNRALLPSDFTGEVRIGDLLDPSYRATILEGIDVVCHAASWSAMWNHKKIEQERFYFPTIDLIDQAIEHGVSRFIMTSSIAVGAPVETILDDHFQGVHTGFWPHIDYLVEVERYMQKKAGNGTQMITLRLGHFVGARNKMGLIPALVPRLKTHMVPWLNKGRSRMPLTADEDLGEAFAGAVTANGLSEFESITICGSEFPTMQEVIRFIAKEENLPIPHYSVSYRFAYIFGQIMEKMPWAYGGSPFLTRSIVHLAENWIASNEQAAKKIGYQPRKSWQTAILEQLKDMRAGNDSKSSLISK